MLSVKGDKVLSDIYFQWCADQVVKTPGQLNGNDLERIFLRSMLHKFRPGDDKFQESVSDEIDLIR